jgi:hypothetical protein
MWSPFVWSWDISIRKWRSRNVGALPCSGSVPAGHSRGSRGFILLQHWPIRVWTVIRLLHALLAYHDIISFLGRYYCLSVTLPQRDLHNWHEFSILSDLSRAASLGLDSHRVDIWSDSYPIPCRGNEGVSCLCQAVVISNLHLTHLPSTALWKLFIAYTVSERNARLGI